MKKSNDAKYAIYGHIAEYISKNAAFVDQQQRQYLHDSLPKPINNIVTLSGVTYSTRQSMGSRQHAWNNQLRIGGGVRNTVPGIVDAFRFDYANPDAEYLQAIDKWRRGDGNNEPSESFSFSLLQKPVSMIDFCAEKDDGEDDDRTNCTCSTLDKQQPHTKKIKNSHVDDKDTKMNEAATDMHEWVNVCAKKAVKDAVEVVRKGNSSEEKRNAIKKAQ
jgi:hypothetical protein